MVGSTRPCAARVGTIGFCVGDGVLSSPVHPEEVLEKMVQTRKSPHGSAKGLIQAVKLQRRTRSIEAEGAQKEWRGLEGFGETPLVASRLPRNYTSRATRNQGGLLGSPRVVSGVLHACGDVKVVAAHFFYARTQDLGRRGASSPRRARPLFFARAASPCYAQAPPRARGRGASAF